MGFLRRAERGVPGFPPARELISEQYFLAGAVEFSWRDFLHQASLVHVQQHHAKSTAFAEEGV